MDFVAAIAGLYHWLTSKNVIADGVRITISFPTQRERYRAEAEIKKELAPQLWPALGAFNLDAGFKLNGLEVKLEHREKERIYGF